MRSVAETVTAVPIAIATSAICPMTRTAEIMMHIRSRHPSRW
jgi:hypothetical protein